MVSKGGFTAKRYNDEVLVLIANTIRTRERYKDGDAIWMEENSPVHASADLKG